VTKIITKAGKDLGRGLTCLEEGGRPLFKTGTNGCLKQMMGKRVREKEIFTRQGI